MDGELVAFIHIASVPSSKASEGFFFAKSSIALSVIDLPTGELVLESVIEGCKGAGNTEVTAGERANIEATDKIIEQLHVQVSILH